MYDTTFKSLHVSIQKYNLKKNSLPLCRAKQRHDSQYKKIIPHMIIAMIDFKIRYA